MDWKEKFIHLFLSSNTGDYDNALALKMAHIPSKLYRYRSLTNENIGTFRFDEIVQGKLFLPHPQELNDPFEVSSLLGSNKPSDYMREKEDFTELFRDVMDGNDFEEIFESDNWYDNLLAFVAKKSVSEEKVESLKTALIQTVMSEFEKFNSTMSDMARNAVRFACFSTTPSNLPMWYHYTDGHKGICLEYNTSDITSIYQVNNLYPVYYVDKIPDMTDMILHHAYPKFGFLTYLAMHKLKDWRYENEWRLILDASSWYRSHDEVPEEFWSNGKTIQFIRPSRIIIGMRIKEAHEEIIREYATLADIPVFKATQTEYGLKVD